jgi:serine/threonine protein kinase
MIVNNNTMLMLEDPSPCHLASETIMMNECGELLNRHQPTAPTYWNGFQLGRTIGRGEFAKVKLAIATESNRGITGDKDLSLVAIKFVKYTNCRATSEWRLQQRKTQVEREARILESLQHSNIVPIHKVWRTEDGMAVIMKYCKDGELFDRVEKSGCGLEESAAKMLFRQLTAAVEYLHNTRKIVHRDLKLVRKNLIHRRICCLTETIYMSVILAFQNHFSGSQ